MLSVIVPVHDGGDHLDRCLQAIRGGTRQPDELIVVDDASVDDSAQIARRHGAAVITVVGGPKGPAHARNEGVARTTCDVVVFVDADVSVHADALARLDDRLLADPELDAVFGSYDDAPADPGLVSQYKNLQHHWVHQHGERVAHTFWAGCGAVRRSAFLAVGGYDEGFARPAIEDIEFGIRLSDAGRRIELDPAILCTHLKRWTLRSMLRADVVGRAMPWSRLIARRGHAPRDLNLAVTGRASGVLAWGALLGAVLAFVSPTAACLGLAALAGMIYLNRGFYHLLWRRGGWQLLLVGIALHWGYYLYAAAIFGCVAAPRLAWRALGRTTRAQPS